jgi:hypothetical protein
MTNEDKRALGQLRLKNYYLQIHLTVVYEKEFIEKLKGAKALEYYRDGILDGINEERRSLGLLS